MLDITASLPLVVVAAVLGYLLGAIPFGLVWARVFNLGDLRQIGSGNIGATNVLRTGSKTAAFLTLICDAGKAGAAVLLGSALLGPAEGQIAGFAAFLGHCFPIYLGFKGGKGVATYLGTLIAVAWPVGLACCATWLVTAALFRISSLAALVASASGVLWALVLGHGSAALLAGLLAGLVWIRHAANISRLLQGTEPRIGKKA